MIICLAEGSGWSSKDDISKEIPPKACSGLIFKGLLLKTLGRIHALREKKQHLKPLKIRPHATKPIDIVLRRTAGTAETGSMYSGHDAFLKVIQQGFKDSSVCFFSFTIILNRRISNME